MDRVYKMPHSIFHIEYNSEDYEYKIYHNEVDITEYVNNELTIDLVLEIIHNHDRMVREGLIDND